MRKTKILVTLGPSAEHEDVLGLAFERLAGQADHQSAAEAIDSALAHDPRPFSRNAERVRLCASRAGHRKDECRQEKNA